MARRKKRIVAVVRRGDSVLGYRAVWEANGRRTFKSMRGAHKYLDDAEARLTQTNAVADGEIWTSIDIIYETRWDCRTARLAAAMWMTRFCSGRI